MEGQISIFEFLKSDPKEWENFRDNYCKKQGGFLRFDFLGHKTEDKMHEVVKGCCFRDKHREKPWDNWQPCTFDRCPFLKGEKNDNT